MENPFSLKGKTTGETPNNFTIIKSITIILVYVSRRKKNLLVFLCSQTHSLCVSKAATLCFLLLDYFLEVGNTLLSPPLLSSRRWQYLTLSFLLRSSQAKIPFFLSWFHALFFLSQGRTLGPKPKPKPTNSL